MDWAAMAYCAAMTLTFTMLSGADAAGERLSSLRQTLGENDVCRECRNLHVRAEPELSLLLELLIVVLRSGASIPGALKSVGAAVGGDSGRALCSVADSLTSGVDWSEAWADAKLDAAGDSAEKETSGKMVAGIEAFVRRRSRKPSTSAGALRTLAAILEPSWRHGSSPVPRMESAIEQIHASRMKTVETGAAELSTAVLIPMALCFLPAFIVIGVLPVIAGWGAMTLL